MKKILSIFAAMLLASSMMADPVVLPATLDVTNVSFRSEGMPDFVIEEGQDYAGTYFDMGAHDSSNDTLLYAEWDVTIEPILYNLSVDVYNTNSWRVQLHLLNQNGDTLKDLRYKGSSGQCGHYAIGSMDLRDLEAGNYKLRARAATAWSQMKLKDVIFEADYQGVNVALPGTLLPAYAVLSDGASVTNNAIAFTPSTANNEYAIWNVSFEAAGSFNVAIDITASNGHNYGVALLSADGQTEIASVNEGGQKSDTGVKELGAIEVPAAGTYTVKLTNAIQWSEAVLNSITFAAPAPAFDPGEPVAIYLKPAIWAVDNAQFGVYAFVPETSEYFSDIMTLVEGETDVYETTIPENYTYVVFMRLNDGATEVAWTNIWNQTVDLQRLEGMDMFTITTWGEGLGAKSDGEWSKYEPAAPVVEAWAEIKFEEAIAADDIAENASFTVEDSEFAITITDPDNKMSIDANPCRFGTAEGYKSYSHRLKTGGKSSSSKNYMTANIPAAGYLRIAVRTGKNEDVTRNLVITQSDTLYNNVVKEEDAIEVIEGESTVKVYPYITVPVVAGTVKLSYPTNGLNFYAFGFKASGTTAINNTAAEMKAVKMIENGQLVIIKNGVRYNVMGTVL